MRWMRQFAAFWYDFIVGGDWVVAVGVVAALALSALLARSGIQAWWVMLIAVTLLLSASLWRATRISR